MNDQFLNLLQLNKEVLDGEQKVKLEQEIARNKENMLALCDNLVDKIMDGQLSLEEKKVFLKLIARGDFNTVARLSELRGF